MTMQETCAGAALHAWIADRGGKSKVTESEKKLFLEAHIRGQRDAALRYFRYASNA